MAFQRIQSMYVSAIGLVRHPLHEHSRDSRIVTTNILAQCSEVESYFMPPEQRVSQCVYVNTLTYRPRLKASLGLR
jgi:hypothetical protein